MMAIDFEGSNIELTKPAGWTDEQCSSLRAWYGNDDAGNPGFLTVWQPNKEDLDAMNRGEPLYLKILGSSFAPVAMFTMNEAGEANI